MDFSAQAGRRILPVLHRTLIVHATIVAAALAATSMGASAQGKLDARYTVTLAGVPIGKGAWTIDIADDQYTAAASGMTTGLLRVFASGQGSSASRGHIVNGGNLVATSYASTITADSKTEELRIVLHNGTVKEYAVDPPWPPHPERIPITEVHRKGVTDPMTAALVRVPGNGDPMSSDVCAKGAAVFDGRLRYDLKLAFKRFEQIAVERGYQGLAVVCAVYFTPIAGYIPDRPAIKYLIAQRDMEIWFAPVTGTRVVVPFRISIPTPLGLGILQATRFVATPQGPRATPTSARIQ
jgi:hypothetical protein